MSFIIQIFGSILVLLVTILVLLPVSILAWPIKNIPTKIKLVSPAWKLFSQSVFLGILCKVHKEDRRLDKTYVMPKGLYVANHQSFVDIPIALTQFIIPPIMKKEVTKIPVFGLIAKSTGAITVDRKDPHYRKKVLKESLKRLDSGISLQIYPEGTRSRTDFPKDFEEIKTPIIQYCYRNKIQVTPVSIYGTKYVLEKTGKLNPFKKLGIIVHEEAFPKDFGNEEEFAKHIWKKVCDGHRELYDKYHQLNG